MPKRKNLKPPGKCVFEMVHAVDEHEFWRTAKRLCGRAVEKRMRDDSMKV
jgi:hypothetical protein